MHSKKMEIAFHVGFVLLISGIFCPSNQQRVAPGVPPQHYDPNQHQQFQQHQPPPQYQQGQVQMQQQMNPGQIPMQNMPHGHGQVPMQGQVPMHQGQVQQQGQLQQQGQVPMQQQQVAQPPHHPQQHVQQHQPAIGGHAPHGHHAPHGQQQLLDASNVLKERQHIQEHMEVPIDTSQMSEQELQFHYFKMHDADNNNRLDGCELVKSLIHWHDQANHDPRAGVPIPEPKIFKDDELSNMIDPILANDDKNKDGFIDYGEFVQAQAAAASRQAAQHAT